MAKVFSTFAWRASSQSDAESADDEDSNERLEFLGDAVLGWVIADLVFRDFGDLAEGALTDLRKSVVNAIALAEVAEELDLGPHILLGRGEAAAGGSQKPSILSDAFEAVLGRLVRVPPHHDVTGAIGAALLARSGRQGLHGPPDPLEQRDEELAQPHHLVGHLHDGGVSPEALDLPLLRVDGKDRYRWCRESAALQPVEQGVGQFVD